MIVFESLIKGFRGIKDFLEALEKKGF